MGYFRFILAILVAAAHLGWVGGITMFHVVETFFIITGFYMGFILDSGKYQTYKDFIINRLLRIYPVYWAFLALIFVACGMMILTGKTIDITPLNVYTRFGSSLSLTSWIYLIFNNLFIVTQELASFMIMKEGELFFSKSIIPIEGTDVYLCYFTLIRAAWSVGPELIFYFLAPFFVNRIKPKFQMIIILILLSYFCKLYFLMSGYDYDPWAYRVFPSHLHLYLLGVLLYYFYARGFIQSMTQKFSSKSKYSLGIIIVALIVIFDCCFPMEKKIVNSLPNHWSHFIDPYLQIFTSRQVLLMKLEIFELARFLIKSFSIALLFHLFKDSRLDRIIGDLSYPLFICHYPVFIIFNVYVPIHSRIAIIEAICLSIIISVFLYYWVQKPIDKYRNNRIKQSNPKFSDNNISLYRTSAVALGAS